jgi:hypothetical protein
MSIQALDVAGLNKTEMRLSRVGFKTHELLYFPERAFNVDDSRHGECRFSRVEFEYTLDMSLLTNVCRPFFTWRSSANVSQVKSF